MRARQGGGAEGGRAHHCATSFMLTLISFITFATQWALPSRPSAAWGSPPAPERASRLRSRREIPNPSSSDSPSFLLPPDAGAPVIPFTRGHAESEREGARLFPFKFVRTHADSSCKRGAESPRRGNRLP